MLALVLAVVLVAAYRDGTGFDALRRYFSYRNQTDGEQVVYPYEASSQNHFAALGEHLVVLSNTNLSILGPSGTEVWSQAVNFAAPALVQAGERAVAYDVGGTELYLLVASLCVIPSISASSLRALTPKKAPALPSALSLIHI